MPFYQRLVFLIWAGVSDAVKVKVKVKAKAKVDSGARLVLEDGRTGENMIYVIAGDIGGRFDIGTRWASEPNRKVKLDRFEMAHDAQDSKLLAEAGKASFQSQWLLCEARLDRLPDALGLFGGFGPSPIVSAELAALVEELEPGQHELLRIPQIWSMADKQEIKRPYFVLNVCVQVPTVDIEQSEVKKYEGPTRYHLTALTPDGCVVLPGAGKNNHIWRDEFTGQIFASQTFRDRAHEVGDKGIDYLATTPTGVW